MNVSGVGVTPPAPQPPPVAPVVPPAQAEASDARRRGGTGERGRPVPEQRSDEREKRPPAPPLRMITLTEMRVMLGQLPPAAAVHEKAPDAAEVRQTYG